MSSLSHKTHCDTLNGDGTQMYNFRYSNKPGVWGPKFWYMLHNSSLYYPDNATKACADQTSNFILALPCILPCSVCRNHAVDYLTKFNKKQLLQICSTKKGLATFFLNMHNYVNLHTGKKAMTMCDLISNIEDSEQKRC